MVVLDRSQKISIDEESFTTTTITKSTALESVTGTEIPDVILTSTITPYQVTSTYSIPTSALPKVEFYKKNGQSVFLHVEVPAHEEYVIGLSGRNSLTGRGMLFKFSDLVLQPFWMKDTFIALSIAFIDADGNRINGNLSVTRFWLPSNKVAKILCSIMTFYPDSKSS